MSVWLLHIHETLLIFHNIVLWLWPKSKIFFDCYLKSPIFGHNQWNRAGNTDRVCLQCQSERLRVDEHLQKNQYAKGRWLLLNRRLWLFWLILQCQSQGQASSKVKRGEFLFIQNVKREKLFVVLQCHAHKFYQYLIVKHTYCMLSVRKNRQFLICVSFCLSENIRSDWVVLGMEIAEKKIKSYHYRM